jgi:hypothetical protein
MWCIRHGITISAIHIPGIANILADNLSRGISLNPTEWSLSRQVFQELYIRKGFLTIDLFASATNHQLPVYCALANDPAALATDAMSISWIGMSAYAFPPISLIHKVIQKINREDCVVVLIAPMWAQQYWFHAMTQLIIDHQILLPQDRDLLRMPGTQARFHEVHKLQLTAWTLSSNASRQRAFRRALPIWHREDEENPQIKSTLRVSDYSTNGVGLARSVLVHVL